MNAGRKVAEKYILEIIEKIAGKSNKELYANKFKTMSDKDFDAYIEDMEKGKRRLTVVVPHDGSVKITVKNNIAIGRSMGYEFFQRLNRVDPSTGDKYLTPNKYFIYRLPIKRVAQLLSKGIAIPKDSKHVDLATGQVTGDSKSVSITMPEVQMLSGMGMENVLLEVLKFRGGDLGAKSAMINTLYKQGRVDAETLMQYSTGVEGTKTLKNYFIAAHIRSEGLDNQ